MRVLTLLVALLALAGCGENEQLQLLREDPMRTWSNSHVRQVSEYTTEPGTSMGKPRYASILWILVVQGESRATALAEMRAAAEGSGWTVVQERPGQSFSAEKHLTVDQQALRVELHAGLQDLPSESPDGDDLYLSIEAYPEAG